MARLSSDARTMLATFEAKQAEVQADEIFNLGEFAAVLGMTSANFRKTWLDPDPTFPLAKMGAEGKDYEINGAEALAHLAGRLRSRILQQDARSARLARLAGVQSHIGEDAALTLAEAREIDRLQQAAHRRNLDEKTRVSAEDHRTTVADLCILTSDHWASVATELDADGRWDSGLRESVIGWARTKQVELHDKFRSYLQEHGRSSSTGETGERVSSVRKRRKSAKRA